MINVLHENEAKEPTQKHNNIRSGQIKMINQMTFTDGEVDPIRPYVIVRLGKELFKEYALIDSEADINNISYETWQAINEPPLTPTKLNISTFAGDKKGPKGYFELTVIINEVDVSHRFYVMEPGEQITPVILGLPWQRTYNAIPLWAKDGIQFTVQGKDVFEPFLGEECYLPKIGDEEYQQKEASDQTKIPAKESKKQGHETTKSST